MGVCLVLRVEIVVFVRMGLCCRMGCAEWDARIINTSFQVGSVRLATSPVKPALVLLTTIVSPANSLPLSHHQTHVLTNANPTKFSSTDPAKTVILVA